MYIFLTLFFTSLTGIIIMIGRKLALVPSREIEEEESLSLFVSEFQKMKYPILESMKKYGHLGVVAILRFHIRVSNSLKNQYGKVKIKIKNINKKNGANDNSAEKVEVSKFLKMISDYKEKIREIKHKIKEEEKKS